MGWHDELFDAGAEIVAEVHGDDAALQVIVAPGEEPIEVDGWLGAVSETDVDDDGRGLRTRRQVQQCEAQAKAVDAQRRPWTPTTATVVVADGARWNVRRIDGLGRPLLRLQLERAAVINKSAGREAPRR